MQVAPPVNFRAIMAIVCHGHGYVIKTMTVVTIQMKSLSTVVRNSFLAIAQFRYFKIQRKTIDITARLRCINPTNSNSLFLEPCAEVYCLTLNFKISKLGYSRFSFINTMFCFTIY